MFESTGLDCIPKYMIRGRKLMIGLYASSVFFMLSSIPRLLNPDKLLPQELKDKSLVEGLIDRRALVLALCTPP